MKLFGLILPLLFIKSDVGLFAVLRGGVQKHPNKTTRFAVDAATLEYIANWVTVLGVTMKDSCLAAMEKIKKQRPLADIQNVQKHSSELAMRIIDLAEKSQQAHAIFLPNSSLPMFPVNDTPFQHLINDVIADQTLTGVSAIHAEPGVGKSVAGALAILQWSQANPKHITVLVGGSLQNLQHFFRIEHERFMPPVAASLFPILCGKGIRLQIILDNIFDKEVGSADAQLLMGLARASHRYGHVIVVSQSQQVATDVANLNGARTRMAPQQRDILEYRWDEPMARQLILCLNATARVPHQMESNSRMTTLWERILRFFGRNPVFAGNSWNQNETKSALEAAQKELVEEDIRKILEATKFPDKAGGWKPTNIQEFLLSGKLPTLPVPVVAAGRA